uniref:Putative LOV domain-containing protein n=1 Tax=Pilularia globulifera TaxID=49509 RepID=A0A126WYR8_9MONI|nr:putative LOV domain-containing protein [Pilularia globulifera]
MGLPIHPQSSIPPIRCSALSESMAQMYDISQLLQSLKNLRHFSFVITDPAMQGNPVVYASDGFLQMCGYSSEEVVGRNPKFLQGPDTDRRRVVEVSDAVREEKPCRTMLLNYTKEGRPYLVVLDVAPVFSHRDRRVVHFVGVQTTVHAHLFSDLLLQCMNRRKKKGALVENGKELLMQRQQQGSSEDNDQLTGTSSVQSYSGQRKKKLKISSTILKLVIHELVSSSRQRNAEVTDSRSLCEIPQTTLCSSLTLALSRIQQSFVLSDPNLPDMPIVYASDKFLCLTGYKRDEILGQNCRVLQGPDTDANAVQQIRNSISHNQSCTIQILNYRKDKTTFWNLLHISSVRDSQGKVAYFVGVQSHVSTCDLGSQHNGVMAPLMHQLGAVGAVKVAIRSLQGAGLRRILPR